jgi:hypothetical protein
MRKAYSLIEAIIAISILSTVTITAIMIITQSANSENLNRDYLFASALNQEAHEFVKNIYSSNLLKFGKEYSLECGMMLPTYTGTADQCDTSEAFKLTAGPYTIAQNFENQSLDIVNLDTARLFNSSGNIDPFNSQNYIIYQREVSSNNDNFSIFQTRSTSGPSGTPTKFYREIYISYSTPEIVNIESTVAWLRAGGLLTRESTSLNINLNE